MMTSISVDFENQNEIQGDPAEGSVRRLPFYLNESREPIFGWLHLPSSQPVFDQAVVICPPIGYEQIHSHRSLRRLADELAREKIPTVRFDWHGTGDSSGSDDDPQRLRAWLDNISLAVQWVRETTNCQKVSLVGLRMGATLASLSTVNNDIENLVLWSPVSKGSTYVREMKALSLTSESPKRTPVAESEDVEAAGFVLNAEVASELKSVDLSNLPPRSVRTLVVSRPGAAADDRLCNRWASQGVRVEQTTESGYIEMMADPHRNKIALAAIRKMTNWLLSNFDSQVPSHFIDDVSLTSSVTMTSQSIEGQTAPMATRLHESVFMINEQPALFGIVSEPFQQRLVNSPVVLLLNAGSVHHVGPNRLNVTIARTLANNGFRCVRMDLSGLGDCMTDVSSSDNDPYQATAFRDIEIAIKQIQIRFGVQKIILMGLCSGAYAAFQSAVQISNPALVESVLINPLTYYWEEGMTLEDSPTRHLRTFHYYKSSALDPMKWVRLLTGRSKIGIRGAAKMIIQRMKRSKTADKVAPSSNTRSRARKLSHPLREDLPGDLKSVSDAGRRLTMYFSRTDPGFDILNFHAKRKANQMRRAGKLEVTFIDDADHTFTMRSARTDLIDAICRDLCKRYQ